MRAPVARSLLGPLGRDFEVALLKVHWAFDEGLEVGVALLLEQLDVVQAHRAGPANAQKDLGVLGDAQLLEVRVQQLELGVEDVVGRGHMAFVVVAARPGVDHEDLPRPAQQLRQFRQHVVGVDHLDPHVGRRLHDDFGRWQGDAGLALGIDGATGQRGGQQGRP
jgi:hypothetical protein